MGYAERSNPNSKWNQKHASQVVEPSKSTVVSPIKCDSSNAKKVSIPVIQDEPMVIEITLRGMFILFKEFLCRMLRTHKTLPQTQGPALTS